MCDFLESLVGPTVRPAEAARLLSISHPALDRWIGKGEISSVLTPKGRREIPLSELVELLEEVEQRRSHPPELGGCIGTDPGHADSEDGEGDQL